MKRLRILPILAVSLLLLFTSTAYPRQAHSGEPPERTTAGPSVIRSEGTVQATDLPPWLARKVEPALLKQIVTQGSHSHIRFIVELANQADLSHVPSGMPRQARRHLVVDQLKDTAHRAQAGLRAFLDTEQRSGRVQEVRPFWVFNGLAVTADAGTLLAVAARPEVRIVREDRWRHWVDAVPEPESVASLSEEATQWNIAEIHADLAWGNLGQDGNGTTVAILDTGVDWLHPALQAQYRGYRPNGFALHEGNWICTTDEGHIYPTDAHGHGTHVTGTAVGGRDENGVAIGVAPGAQWIAAKALSDLGWGYDSWIHAAFEWLLAPADDPALAPDVVNCSWGSPDDEGETFRADLQALRAAGIAPVFAAGNNGPSTASLDSPASNPEAIAVAALDDLNQVTSFSSRGPSPWGETKPEIAAPGAQIRSSLPGGIYGVQNGTSMAAPHVAGVVALMLQADPSLSVDDVEAIITSTALPLGEQIPNNETGWGLVDAYRSSAVALKAGFVTGRVTRQPDLQPLPTAQITAYDHLGEPQATARADALGHYNLALPEGIYSIEASAFGYSPSMAHDLLVQASTTMTLNMQLSPAPAGVLWGEVRHAETGGPVSTRISIEGTPAWTTSDPQTGRYSLALPSGTYSVQASQNGFRRETVSEVPITIDQATRLDLALTPAPTLLLVDSGRWYYGSQASYFESALDDRDYVYDEWEIRDFETDLPELADLESYDVAIWSSPRDSPALIGAGDVISDYLGFGGGMLLSGQDIGYWDDGLSGILFHPYYRQFLKAEALADDAGRPDLVGLPGEILEGLTLPMNGADSAQNQVLPDLIDVLDPLDASLIGVYEDVGGAALRVSGCQSYNAVYLAAGLEGLGDQETRAEVMDRALTWLDTPHPGIAVRMTPLHQETVWLEGSHITYTVELQNQGAAADQFDLELSPSAWPVSIWDAGFTEEITQSVSLGSCQTQTVGIQVAVPPDIGWNLTDVVTLTARSHSDPGVATQAIFSTKTPAPILLVDDHRWYDHSDRYRDALETRGLPYDAWRNPQTPTADFGSPSLQRLARYPVVIWFTSYDWHNTLTPNEEATLSAYLDGGGRLLLSSQDYLYTSGFTDFARNYLGVVKYTEGLAVTQTMGAVGQPAGNGLPPMDLVYPFRNFSDALRPSPLASIAFWGQHGQPVALTRASAPWKTAFYAFAIEAFGPDDLPVVLGNTVDWLSPLGDSALKISPPAVGPGSELTCTLSVRNTGPRPLSEAALSNPIPLFTSFVPGSLEGPAAYEPGTQKITWTGALTPGQEITVTYRLRVDRPLPDGTVIESTALLSDETGLSLERVATSRIDSPYLGGSAKIVSAGISPPGHVLTYTLYLQNDGLQPAQARLTDPIPAYSSYLPGSAWASSGLLTSTEQLLVWSGTIGTGEVVTVTFPVIINPIIQGLYVHNRASLEDGWGEVIPLETYTLVGRHIFLPLILKGF